ncbi:polysaccharide pyruvyl transferase family protein [Streptomyces aidingensis]|nr:polysaccharide pyruvyl transferase family protein [Streptomyces aidingensis]
MGVAYELEEIHKAEGEDWADICRKKIGFLARVCEENPDKKVFWTDVDCVILKFPPYVVDFTADLIGFQRGFSSPLRIGYANRTRFWEPCFFGVNTTPMARKFIEDAKVLEQNADIKATDDYFFEESWRANAANMSFQVIPSVAVLSKATGNPEGVTAFYSFGSSGHVKDFKDVVVQHGGVDQGTSVPLFRRARRQALRGAKLVERRLPERASKPLRRLADSAGLTHLLTSGGLVASGAGPRHRQRISTEMIMAGQRGEKSRLEDAYLRLTSSGIPTPAEIAAKKAADAFAVYAGRKPDAEPIKLAWWAKPFPGNFGDWLGPMIFAEKTERSIVYQGPTSPSTDPHLMSVGSIGRFIKPSSIVVGTGISTDELELDRKAEYLSVRGPITAEVVRRSGGPLVDSLGDPGVLISRIVPVQRGLTNGKTVLVRHFTHANLPVTLPEGMEELSVLMSHPDAIRTFVTKLNEYDAVVTSAMHVMIICHSYGIPCALVTFEGMESTVHGNGIKYRDYCLGAGLDTVYEPVVVSPDLTRLDLGSMMSKEKITDDKLDEVEQAVASGVTAILSRIA